MTDFEAYSISDAGTMPFARPLFVTQHLIKFWLCGSNGNGKFPLII